MNEPVRIVTIANQKGGVGKTTTVMNLGVALAEQGYRVLLIDSDPQANLTSYLGVSFDDEQYASLKTLDELYLGKRIPQSEDEINAFIAKTRSGVDLLAADGHLSGVDYYLFSRKDKESVLKKFLESIQDRYQFILIDTPPSLNLLTINALVASHRVLIPMQPEFFSLEGIVKVREIIQNIRDNWNPELSVLGVLPTQVSARRRLTSEVIELLRGEIGAELFESQIRDNAAVTESSGHGKSVLHYQKNSPGAQDYLKAAEEFVKRCNHQTETSEGMNL